MRVAHPCSSAPAQIGFMTAFSVIVVAGTWWLTYPLGWERARRGGGGRPKRGSSSPARCFLLAVLFVSQRSSLPSKPLAEGRLPSWVQRTHADPCCGLRDASWARVGRRAKVARGKQSGRSAARPDRSRLLQPAAGGAMGLRGSPSVGASARWATRGGNKRPTPERPVAADARGI